MEPAVLHVTSLPDINGRTVVRVRAIGELDLTNAAELRQTLNAAAAREPDRVDVDLADVTFFDCAALHALEYADTTAEGRLRLVGASRAVRLVLASSACSSVSVPPDNVASRARLLSCRVGSTRCFRIRRYRDAESR